jgi:NADH:ubiquinone oxidoreductase subunit 6 (subunit J)
MMRLLRAGFQVLVLGLNLMAIRYVLLLTSASPMEVTSKLVFSGAVITFIGFAIIAIGITPKFLKTMPEQQTVILSIGPSVMTLGIAMIIRAIGHGDENILWIGAWVASGIGLALILSYCIWYVRNSMKSPRDTLQKK